MSEAPEQQPAPFADLPLYKCHKQVRAFKISQIEQGKANEPTPYHGGSYWLLSTPPNGHAVEVPVAYMNKHDPAIGGYFVAYEDGYISYSPAKAFEDGYTKA